jgi:hypothetical protein
MQEMLSALRPSLPHHSPVVLAKLHGIKPRDFQALAFLLDHSIWLSSRVFVRSLPCQSVSKSGTPILLYNLYFGS